MIIRSHSVPILPGGLSPMQERVLCSKRFVRLVSAPTGAGKSYAFMRAVLEEEAQVLFIVPTKRLLQNLVEGAQEQAHAPSAGPGLGRGAEGCVDQRTNRRVVRQPGQRGAGESRRNARQPDSRGRRAIPAERSSSPSLKWWSG